MRSVIGGGLKSVGGIPYRAAVAKRLRYKPDIYARYGGDDGDCEALVVPANAGTHNTRGR